MLKRTSKKRTILSKKCVGIHSHCILRGRNTDTTWAATVRSKSFASAHCGNEDACVWTEAFRERGNWRGAAIPHPISHGLLRVSLARSVLNQLQQAFVRVLGDCLGKSGPFVVFHTLKMSMSACGSYLLWEKNETHFPLLVIFKNSLLIVQRGPGRFKEDYSNQLIL